MRKKNVFSAVILALALIGVVLWGLPFGIFQPRQSIAPSRTPLITDINSGSSDLNHHKIMEQKILIVIAFKDFKDEEYFVPKRILEEAGFLIETASSQKGVARGVEGGDAIVSITPNETEVKNYAAVIFVGGPGMARELDNLLLQKLAQDFLKEEKIVSAICIAPVLLAKAGILERKKATVWSSPLDKNAVKILEDNGAIYEKGPVVIDGNIITANGPSAAEEFGKAIVKQLGI